MHSYSFNPVSKNVAPGDVYFIVAASIKADIETVWNNAIKAVNVKKYFTTDSLNDLETLGEVLWVWGDETALIEVDEVEQLRKISFHWNAPFVDYAVRTEFTFEESNGRVNVKIKESGWLFDVYGIKSSYANCSGWTEYLCALRVFTEFGISFFNSGK